MNLASAKAESLGHLGLVAATLHDLDLMNKIDDQPGGPDSIKGWLWGSCCGYGVKWIRVHEHISTTQTITATY